MRQFFVTIFTPFRWMRRIWRRSLLFRVTASTVVLSSIVVTVLGFSLLSRVTTGLLDAKEVSSVGEASAGLGEAQRLLDAANTGPSTPSPARLVDSVVTILGSRSGSPATFEVLLLSSGNQIDAPERGTNLVAVSSIPVDLRESIQKNKRQSWTFSPINFLDGRVTPGLIVGAPLTVPTVGPYELYYLFPLEQEQETLDLVSSSVVGTGIVLVILVAVVALLVTRQVVVPVREAARIARRFSSGKLSERMQVKKEDDLAQLARSFNDMAQSLATQIRQLEELSQLQQRFVSDVSHELRTPLTTIRMAADVMYEDRGAFDASTARSVELLQTQLDRFEALLVDLLEISRFDAGAAVLDVERVDLVALVERIIVASEPLAARNNLRVRFAAYEKPCLVECDPRRIDRVMRNLLDNAIEHANELGVVVELAGNESAISVTVRDFGVGLHPGEASLVFSRFWRADKARARTTGGTGLGLAIALEDTRLHAGWLEAWGEPGHGACFRLTLPRVIGGSIDGPALALFEDMDSEVPRESTVIESSVIEPAPHGMLEPGSPGDAHWRGGHL
ncbi:MAG: HAMP domain-containing histidine kinase [Candidatus Nanopelagicales bacterium]|nr:HAMP domain-containing histidine kinase [Candidatus Nanopelagicales bacterium]